MTSRVLSTCTAHVSSGHMHTKPIFEYLKNSLGYLVLMKTEVFLCRDKIDLA